MPEQNAVPDIPRGGFEAVTDPDEAVRTAIKAAVDAGRFDLAARLLDVLRQAPKPGAVVVAAGDEGFELDDEQIASLRESIDEANLGELVSLDEVLSGR